MNERKVAESSMNEEESDL